MNRRDAVQYISVLLGTTVIGADLLLSGCNNTVTNKAAFTSEDIALLDEIADTILPETKTPGAKAAQTGRFMAVMVEDCYKQEDQKIFREGLQKIEELANQNYGNSFTKIRPDQRRSLLIVLDTEQKTLSKDKDESENRHYFLMMKQLALLGYFTSEIGYKQAQRYVEVPGRYDGCIPYKKGDKAFV